MSSDAAAAFLARLRAAQEALGRGEYETAFAGVADDVVWELSEWVFDGGRIEGRDELERYFRRLAEAIDWQVRATEVTELGPGRFLAHMRGVATGRTTGIAETREFFAAFELDSDGRVKRVREGETPDAALAARD